MNCILKHPQVILYLKKYLCCYTSSDLNSPPSVHFFAGICLTLVMSLFKVVTKLLIVF